MAMGIDNHILSLVDIIEITIQVSDEAWSYRALRNKYKTHIGRVE